MKIPYHHHKEWLGDALLAFYAREWGLDHVEYHHVSKVNRLVHKVEQNKNLAAFAAHRGITGGANEVERMIYREFQRGDEHARKFVAEICEFVQAKGA